MITTKFRLLSSLCHASEDNLDVHSMFLITFHVFDALALRSLENYIAFCLISRTENVVSQNGAVSIFKFEPAKIKGKGLPRPASVRRALSTLEMEVEQIKKGSYDHYMQVTKYDEVIYSALCHSGCVSRIKYLGFVSSGFTC